jgi:hypothetical protein
MLDNLDDYSLLEIMKYLNNKSSLNFVLTSKYFKNLFCGNGFAKQLILNSCDKAITLMDRYNKHYRTLYLIYIHNIANPQHWIFGKWCKVMHFYNCLFSDKIDPCDNFDTEKLTIINYCNDIKFAKINWKKFPNLKSLKLKVYDVDLDDLEYCKNLEIIYIELEYNKIFNNKTKIILKNIEKLTKIKYIFTNCILENNFKSKTLIKCITKKDNVFNLEALFNRIVYNQ